jgi:hypothetical protein
VNLVCLASRDIKSMSNLVRQQARRLLHFRKVIEIAMNPRAARTTSHSTVTWRDAKVTGVDFRRPWQKQQIENVEIAGRGVVWAVPSRLDLRRRIQRKVMRERTNGAATLWSVLLAEYGEFGARNMKAKAPSLVRFEDTFGDRQK